MCSKNCWETKYSPSQIRLSITLQFTLWVPLCIRTIRRSGTDQTPKMTVTQCLSEGKKHMEIGFLHMEMCVSDFLTFVSTHNCFTTTLISHHKPARNASIFSSIYIPFCENPKISQNFTNAREGTPFWGHGNGTPILQLCGPKCPRFSS